MREKIKTEVRGGIVLLACSTCLKQKPATSEYFKKAIAGNALGVRSPCKECQSKYDLERKRARREKKELRDKEELLGLRLSVLKRGGFGDDWRDDYECLIKNLTRKALYMKSLGFVIDAMRINMLFSCGHPIAQRVYSAVK